MKPGSIICDLATSQGGNVAFQNEIKLWKKTGLKLLDILIMPLELLIQHQVCWQKI